MVFTTMSVLELPITIIGRAGIPVYVCALINENRELRANNCAEKEKPKHKCTALSRRKHLFEANADRSDQTCIEQGGFNEKIMPRIGQPCDV